MPKNTPGRPAHRRNRRLIARALLMVFGSGLAQPAIGQSAAGPPPARDAYTHPFQDIELIDGRIPLLDIKTSPSGGRFAVLEYAGALSEQPGAETKLFSGVAELERRQMTAAELADGRDTAGGPGDESSPASTRRLEAPKIAPSAQRVIDLSISDDSAVPVLVEITLQSQRGETLQQRMNRAVALGLVETAADATAVQTRLLGEIASEAAAEIDPVATAVRGLGGEVVYACEYAACLTARLAPAQIRALADRPEVRQIALPAVLSDADSLDGVLINEAYQTRQYWDYDHLDGGVNYHLDGDNGQGTDVTFAILERSGFRTSHRAFAENSGTGSRIRGAYDCDGGSCVVANWGNMGLLQHPTAALGSVFADFTDNQSPQVVGVTQEERSAPGREAKAWLYDVNYSSAQSLLAYNHLVGRNPKPNLVSYSIPEETGVDDVNCMGTDTRSENVDEVLFENGVLMFIAAGNTGGTPNDCRLWSPAAAAGAFTVGGWGKTSSTYADACDVRDEGMNASSSWGGTLDDFDEGRRRSIVDATGAYCQADRPHPASDTGRGTFCGTSVATPSVAGAAIDLIDNFKTNYSNYIDDPGALFTAMLMMGDRSTSGQADNAGLDGKLWGRFDHRYGAGKIRMRMVNGEGMDVPWFYYHGWTCVDNGETYVLPINNGQALSTDFDSAKAVIWWYDRRMHDSDSQLIDNVNLYLTTTGGSTLQSSTDGYDNKERVYYRDVGGRAVQLEIRGQSVTADNAGCGANSMKVYFALMLEDDDRDDADGPTWNAATCQGVEPL